MTDDKYNGWTNYETWNVKLWQDNDEGTSGYWTERAQEAYDNAEADDTDTREQNAAIALADEMKDRYQEDYIEAVGEAGVFSDLLGAAVSQVNWREIADHWIEDVDKDDDES